MKDYKYIFFDLDGTLTDPGLGITNSVAYSLEKYGISVDDRSELYKFIGPPLIDSYMDFYNFSKEKAVQAVEVYREYYAVKGIFENYVYDGIPGLLKLLQADGKKIILATSKPEEYAKIILEHFDLAKYFFYIAGSNMDESRSKKSEVISYALQKCQIKDKSQVVMIGDREHDIIGAKEIGLDSIGVLYGYGDYKELECAGADQIVENVNGLRDILCKK
ncbi:MAG: HAD family hydrolase [Lachnospiraceae bacterium]|nr:HAD family hydrolase [Lachnospiraceae bacterium]